MSEGSSGDTTDRRCKTTGYIDRRFLSDAFLGEVCSLLQEVPPLRFAPVGMTIEGGAATCGVMGFGREAFRLMKRRGSNPGGNVPPGFVDWFACEEPR